VIEDIKLNAEFIHLLQNASLDDSGMSLDDIERLRNPTPDRDGDFDLTNPAFVHSVKTFAACANGSDEIYNKQRSAYLERHPDEEFLSLFQIKRRIELLTGVIAMEHDMCPKGCIAYVAMFHDHETCPRCGEPRYDPVAFEKNGQQQPRRRFTTIPIGPIIQAFYYSRRNAERMQYFLERLEEIQQILDTGGAIPRYNDTCCGKEFIDLFRAGKISLGDIVLQLSLDGAQLFRDKASNWWIYIFIIHNLSPDLRYRKSFVIPGGFIPGTPDLLESFLFPGLYHISALQREGFKYFDAFRNILVTDSRVILALLTADGPGMSAMAGTVGHGGKYGCRQLCSLPGRHRDGDSHYYPAMLKPHNFAVVGCDHNDVSFQQLHEYRQNVSLRYRQSLELVCSAPNPTQYATRHRETGIMRPCILDGLRYTLGVPQMFVMDLMHLADLNDPDLILGLWRGQMKCYGDDDKADWDWVVLVGKVWEAHGETVARCTPFLPSSFGRAPRDPSQKINSSYKAWEFLLYLYWLGPALLRHILPEKYWTNYCQFVRGMRLAQQFGHSPDDIKESMKMFCEFEQDFERLYYQRNPNRLHFIRQSIHLLTHITPETIRIGPLACYSQWAMETAIGNLGGEIRSLVDPYANLANRGVFRAQLNSLNAMLPNLSLYPADKPLPPGSRELGEGYAFFRPMDRTVRDISDAEAIALKDFWTSNDWPNDRFSNQVWRWGRLKLPNGQIGRSVWSENRSMRTDRRRATVVKVSIQSPLICIFSS
jgi:hypothetical protein